MRYRDQHNPEMYDTFTSWETPQDDDTRGALLWLLVLLAFAGAFLLCLPSQGSTQTLAFSYDLAGFRREVVGVPVPVDPDNNPATSDWLVRMAEETRFGESPAYASMVLRGTGTGFCAGQPFLRSSNPHPDVVVTPRTLTTRNGTVLLHFVLDAPQCEEHR